MRSIYFILLAIFDSIESRFSIDPADLWKYPNIDIRWQFSWFAFHSMWLHPHELHRLQWIGNISIYNLRYGGHSVCIVALANSEWFTWKSIEWIKWKWQIDYCVAEHCGSQSVQVGSIYCDRYRRATHSTDRSKIRHSDNNILFSGAWDHTYFCQWYISCPILDHTHTNYNTL